MATQGSTGARYRVRVWCGGYPIAVYIAERPLAERYAAAMRRRFIGLQVTSELLPAAKKGSRG
jgi:hypothetical protein